VWAPAGRAGRCAVSARGAALRALPARAVGVPPGAKSTTGPVLRRLRTLLVTGTAVALGVAFWALAGMHAALAAEHEEAVPALTALDAAAAALRRADDAAAGGFAKFTPGSSELAAPGPNYQDQLAAANQSLAQVAEFNVAGERATLILGRVQGQLVAYANLVASAQGYFQRGDARLGAARMWDASHLLRRGDEGGVLHGLNELGAEQQRTVADRARSGWMSWWAVPLWTVPLVLLLALLVGTQLFLRRRLGRAVNLWLLAATVLLAGTVGYGVAMAERHLKRGRADLVELRLQTQSQAINDLLGCSNPDCGPTVARDTSLQGNPALLLRTEQPTEPPGGVTVLVLLPVTALLVGTLTVVGLQAPIAAYRFERR
jgi:hypothetical protein